MQHIEGVYQNILNRFRFLEYMTELCNILSLENICNVEIVMDNASFHRCYEISIF